MSTTRIEPPSDRSFLASPDWWGPRWLAAPDASTEGPTKRLSIVELIGNGTLSLGAAALLWELIDRGVSVVVIAGPSGAGKTTLLTALTDFVPADEPLIPVRGRYDPLRFLASDGASERRTTLAVNEISPHLPIYLWGPSVGQILQATNVGFRLFSTAHARSAEELIGQLAGYPLRIPMTDIAALGVVVRLRIWQEDSRTQRSVDSVSGLAMTERGGITLSPLMDADDREIDRSVVDAWLAVTEQPPSQALYSIRHNVLQHVVAQSADEVGERTLRPDDLQSELQEACGGT